MLQHGFFIRCFVIHHNMYLYNYIKQESIPIPLTQPDSSPGSANDATLGSMVTDATLGSMVNDATLGSMITDATLGSMVTDAWCV